MPYEEEFKKYLADPETEAKRQKIKESLEHQISYDDENLADVRRAFGLERKDMSKEQEANRDMSEKFKRMLASGLCGCGCCKKE
jgi:hypothetical protein